MSISVEEKARDYGNTNKCSFCAAVRYGVKDPKKCTEKKCEQAADKAYRSLLDTYQYGADGRT